MHAILGKKQGQTQKFLVDGTRVPVTIVEVKDNPVVAVQTMDKNGYLAVQLGYGTKNHANKPQIGHSKKGANLEYAPYFLREIRLKADAKAEEIPAAGEMISAASVLEAGDLVDVTGKSKGKGFAGVVKRHHFKGGPRTHGQSDRERAPGSVGQTTTPGRVYKGKRMAGKMGNDMVTLKNLEVIDVTADGVFIKGLVPGIVGTYVVIKKVGKNKKHVAILKEEVATPVEAVEEAAEAVQAEAVAEAPAEVAAETPVVEEVKAEAAPAAAPKNEGIKAEAVEETKGEEQKA